MNRAIVRLPSLFVTKRHLQAATEKALWRTKLLIEAEITRRNRKEDVVDKVAFEKQALEARNYLIGLQMRKNLLLKQIGAKLNVSVSYVSLLCSGSRKSTCIKFAEKAKAIFGELPK